MRWIFNENVNRIEPHNLTKITQFPVKCVLLQIANKQSIWLISQTNPVTTLETFVRSVKTLPSKIFIETSMILNTKNISFLPR